MKSFIRVLFKILVVCGYIYLGWVSPIQEAPTDYGTLYVVVNHLFIFMVGIVGMITCWIAKIMRRNN